MSISNSTKPRQLRLYAEDISPAGIRLFSNQSLLGQKLRVTVPSVGRSERTYVVRIQWTHRLEEDRYENGGTFVDWAQRDDMNRFPSAQAMR